MAEDESWNLDMKKIGILAAGTYLFFDYTKPTKAQAEYWKVWEEKNTSEYRKNLLEKAFVKADINKDGVLQKNEISGLLKKIGLTTAIPETTPISLDCISDISKSYIDYSAGFSGDKIQVDFSREDLERYLARGEIKI